MGLALGKFLTQNGHSVKGSTTTPDKIQILNGAGVKAYHLALPDIIDISDFFNSEVLITALPPSINNYNLIIEWLIKEIITQKVSWVLFVSSTSVYPNSNEVVKEEDAENIVSTHSGVNLLEVEELFRSNPHFKTTILRFAGLYGPGREPGRFLAGKKNLKGPAIPVNLIHLDDCVGIIHSIIENGIKEEVFNACAPEHPTRKDFYTKACHALGLEPPEFSTEPAPYKQVNSDKLIKALDYQFLHRNPMRDV